MNLNLTEQVDSESKRELHGVMSRLLELLREILASVHEEQIIIENDRISGLAPLLERRQQLLNIFQDCYLQFADVTSTLPSLPEEELSLLQMLEHIQILLCPDDVDLLLLVDQLVCIVKEMQGETNTLVHFLELKSAALHPRNMLVRKVSPPQVRLAVEVAEEDQIEN